MPADLIISPEVQQDLAEAYAWYEGQRSGLGEEFLTCVEACVHGICRLPGSRPAVRKNYRRGPCASLSVRGPLLHRAGAEGAPVRRNMLPFRGVSARPPPRTHGDHLTGFAVFGGYVVRSPSR